MLQCDKVNEAFWNCKWYNMPPNMIKDIMYCILRSQNPLALKIGKFSYFGNNTLTIVIFFFVHLYYFKIALTEILFLFFQVTKTAMGYLSVLRHFLIIE